MKKVGLIGFLKIFVLAFMLIAILEPSLMALEVDYTEGLDQLDEVGKKGQKLVSTFGTLFLTVLAWIIFVGIPLGSLFGSHKYFKEKDERENSNASSAMTWGKSVAVSLVGLFLAGLLFKFIFISVFHVHEMVAQNGANGTLGEVIKSVLMADWNK